MTDSMIGLVMTDLKEIKSELPFSRNGWQRISVFKEEVNTQSASNRSEVIRWIIGQELETVVEEIWCFQRLT